MVAFFVMVLVAVGTNDGRVHGQRVRAVVADLRADPNIRSGLTVDLGQSYIEFVGARNGLPCNANIEQIHGHWYITPNSIDCFRHAVVQNPRVRNG